MHKKIFLVILSILLVVVFISISRPRVYKKKTEAIADRLPFEKEGIPAPMLVPARPEDYGMVVFEQSAQPPGEAEINALIHRKMQDIKTQFPEEVLSKVGERIKEDPEKTKEKLAKIDETIIKCRQILKDDPYNEEARNRLQNLLILKSIAEELPEK
ncbi:MAG: hypothetical protein Q8R31_06135 [Candidatus Omnitrophota bacterium]|nr:hypothetical protein [Candidatus Omnitrophota bacterium]